MAFFKQVLKARKLKNARLVLHDEKLKSIQVSKGAKIDYTICQRIRYVKIIIKKTIKDFFRRIFSLPENTWFHKKALLLRTDGTLENYVLKSIFGFLGGIFLTYLFFIFFVFQLHFSLTVATLWCSLLGVILTLGMAFSKRIRCLVFLIMPQFFSKRGRQALMAYAFILTLTGPAKNTLNNIGVLSESLSCGEEHLKAVVKAILDLIKEPFNAIKDAITRILKNIKVIVNRIKRALIAIKRLVLNILKVIQSVYQWLASVVNMCNKKLGTPFERCNKAFEDAVVDCEAKLGSFVGKLCNLSYVVGAICYVVKPLDFICILVTFVSDAIVKVIQRKIKKLMKHIKAMFYVKVKFSHSFHFESNRSRTNAEVAKEISTELKQRTDKFFLFFDMLSCMTSFFFLLLFVRVILYRHKWLTNLKFDNRYLTNYLRDIDLRRARLDKETVLPLNPREKNKYVPLSSLFLLKTEKIKLTKSAIFMGLISFKLLFQMAIDYSLYWILNIIRVHGQVDTKIPEPNSVGVKVSGKGFLADLYRSIINAFSLPPNEAEVDMNSCLPDPIPPNYDRYYQILTLMFFCWIIIIFEPYGLRLRQCVMISYHPDRAKERAVWLYNHILRSRGNFLKFARRQLRRKFGMSGAQNTEKVTFKERLTAICPILNKCFGSEQITCILCGAVQRDEQNPHVKCPTPDCIGIFCAQCFSDLQNLCTICKSPLDYGDFSDVSEEKDSSEEEARKRLISLTKEEMKEIEEIRDDAEVYKIEGVQITEEDISTISSSTEYSYSYQDEESQVDKLQFQKVPFKDVEAQKLRDDVSTQIFSSLNEETDSECQTPSCFGLRSRRKQNSKIEDNLASGVLHSSEEIEEEELMNLTLEDKHSRRLLLPKYEKRKQEKRRSSIKKLFTDFFKGFRLGKKKQPNELQKDAQKKKKEDEEMLIYSSSSSISSSSYSSDYQEKLKVKSYDSLDESSINNEEKKDWKYPHEKQFFTKELPKGLMPIAKKTRYFEVDERTYPDEDIFDEITLKKEEIKILSDDKSSSDSSEITEIWTISNDSNYSYQLDRLEESDESKRSVSSLITSVKEDIPESLRSINIQYNLNKSTDDSRNYVDITGVSSNSSIKKFYSDKNQFEASLAEEAFYKAKAIQTEEDKFSTERRLLRRRYNQNYYSSSETEILKRNDESLKREEDIRKKKIEKPFEEKSPNLLRSCKHCCERKTCHHPKQKDFRADCCSRKTCNFRKPDDKSHCKFKNKNLPKTREKSSSESAKDEESDSSRVQSSKQKNENTLSQKCKLIEELKRDDRMKSIRKKEDERQRRHDILKYMREQGSIQRESKSPHMTRTKKKRNTLPYQETEAFKSLIKEYQEKALGEEKIISEDCSGKVLFWNQLDSESTSSYISRKMKDSSDNETTN